MHIECFGKLFILLGQNLHISDSVRAAILSAYQRNTYHNNETCVRLLFVIKRILKHNTLIYLFIINAKDDVVSV